MERGDYLWSLEHAGPGGSLIPMSLTALGGDCVRGRGGRVKVKREISPVTEKVTGW